MFILWLRLRRASAFLQHSGDPYADAKATRDTVVPKMAELRLLSDKLETPVG